MDAYLPWIIILAMASFALSGFRQRKGELTESDRRSMAFAALPALVMPVALVCYLYFR